ncbi:LptF/LptG family permease [Flavobacteriaceae bacterium XHP0103]|uniref:LptF/LptG family permease n=1 Tax=Marixanthotalea marina TaxID=2844359 RepID=UPI002989F156|nr:LptF/LptG family permease [Marixanthotalea marina]MBU3822959.1 LptF/LptG family permease [Marixanthotalea marina]
MKILDRYILTTYLKTFISVFSILVLIFVLQTIWLYIGELAGKDLDMVVIVKFIFYVTPKLMPLILPLTILLSSIMVFGSFAENYEFAAMKSTGISLQRAMSGLSIFIVALGFVTFIFANNIIPWAEYNFYNLRVNIKKSKPSMAIAKGQFNEIGTYNIKVEDKKGEGGKVFDDVTIHIKDAAQRTNAETIKSKSGELISEEESPTLSLILKDGNYYNDIQTRNLKEKQKQPFAKGTFERYTINIDLSQMDVDFDDKSTSNTYNMLSIGKLDYTLDSLAKTHMEDQKIFYKAIYQRSNINKSVTAKELIKKDEPLENEKITDSIFTGNVLDLYPLNEKIGIVRAALSNADGIRQYLITKVNTDKPKAIIYARHIISLHEKLALGFACVILFFVGAPLGALIRKGGIGLPLVIAIFIFLTYHFIGIFATNSAKSGGLNPVLAPWFSTLIMFPLSVYLTKRATQDKGLFEFGNIIDPIKGMLNIKSDDKLDYKFFATLKNEKLLDIVKNYNTLGYEEDSRFEAIQVLNSRGKTTEELSEEINIKSDFAVSQNIAKNFFSHAKFSIVLYWIGIILLVLFFVFRNNKLPSLASSSIQLSIILLVLYGIYYVKSIFNMVNLYKHINKKISSLQIMLLIIGLPLYMLTHLFLKSEIKQDLKQNCLDSLK